MTKFAGLRIKTYNYLIDDGIQVKRAKKVYYKRKVSFGNYKICLELTQIEDKINYIEKYEISIGSIKENYTEFTKNKTLTLKIQQRFKTERQIVFTEEINKTDLSSNDDKRMQSIDLIKHMHMERAKIYQVSTE